MNFSNRYLIVPFCLVVCLLCTSQIFAQRNVAYGQPVKQSSVHRGGAPELAVDHNTDGNWAAGSVTHTEKEIGPWWEVDLGQVYNVEAVEIYNRTDCCDDRIDGASIYFRNTKNDKWRLVKSIKYKNTKLVGNTMLGNIIREAARYVRIVRVANEPVYLSMAEVKVITNDLPPKKLLPVAWAFKNEGGYVARYTLSYHVEGASPTKIETGDVLLGASVEFEIPGEAVNIQMTGKAATGLFWEPWKEIFSQDFWKVSHFSSNQIRTYGTTLDPKFTFD